MLYTRELFEPLTDEQWEARRAAQRIRELVADADDALRGSKLLWRADAWDGWHGTSPMKNLYVGAAGVLWGLDRLRARGHAETRLDLADLAVRTVELFRARPDFMKGMKLPAERESSLACGETGILLVAWRLAPDATIADELYARVRANVDSEVEEVMWGAPGTLLAAHAMFESTGEARWRTARDETAAALWSRRDGDGFWMQRMYGQEFRGLQPWHGLAGNVSALLPALDEERRATLVRETAAALERTAVVEDGLANWPAAQRPVRDSGPVEGVRGNREVPPTTTLERPQLASPDGQIRLQFCCGAPGIVATASDYLDEELLLAGGELAWRAGPPGMEKGPCICHGTAGTGHAFLKLFERTGDERWLDRARGFAIHALAQVERRGHGRYSLWTGDIGVALFTADCIEGRSELPIFDVL